MAVDLSPEQHTVTGLQETVRRINGGKREMMKESKDSGWRWPIVKCADFVTGTVTQQRHHTATPLSLHPSNFFPDVMR